MPRSIEVKQRFFCANLIFMEKTYWNIKYLDCNFHKEHGIVQNIWIVCGEAHLVLHGNWNISVAATNPQEDPQFRLKLSASSWLGAVSIQQTMTKFLDPAMFGKYVLIIFIILLHLIFLYISQTFLNLHELSNRK